MSELVSLLVHDERYSKHDLLIHPNLLPSLTLHSLILITTSTSPPQEILLKVTSLVETPHLQLSISQHISTLLDITPRSLVKVRIITDLESVSCGMIEIGFRDQYIGRSDMWQMKQSLIGTAIYIGKKVSTLGIQGRIKSICTNEPKLIGYITENTQMIFRSETAKFYIFIQMSQEMWTFDEDGEVIFEKCVHGFLPDLFRRWSEGGANHLVSIVMFARVTSPSPSSGFIKSRSCFYKDFYRVVVDWESRPDWSSTLFLLKQEFNVFQRDILQRTDSDGNTTLYGVNTTASQGNILEAVNLALNPFDKHYIDRDLSRTGLSIVVVTPSTGVFEVESKLCRMTTQRMVDNGISLDLVCLSRKPLHSVPLFQFAGGPSGGSISLRGGTIGSIGSANGNGSEEEEYMIPDWIELSYWVRNGLQNDEFEVRCHIKETDFNVDMPYLDIFDKVKDAVIAGDIYDESIFKCIITSSASNDYERSDRIDRSRSPAFGNSFKYGSVEESPIDDGGEYSTSIEPIKILRSNREHHFGSLSSRDASPHMKHSPSKPSMKLNPFTISSVGALGSFNGATNASTCSGMGYGSGYGKVSTEGQGTNWKSLCFPACLPLTTEVYPSPDELAKFYQEYTYTVSPLADVSIEEFLIELISQRLAQGFQLVIRATKSKAYFVSLGSTIHRLYYDASGCNVEVKRYTRKVTYDTSTINYNCNVWARFMNGYEGRFVTFSYAVLMSYNWNYLDHLISGYQDQMVDALRFWRIRFLLIPATSFSSATTTASATASGQNSAVGGLPTLLTQSSQLSQLSQIELKDELDEEEERLVGFQRFMEMIEKARFKPATKKLDIQLTTLNLSSLVSSEEMHHLLPEAFVTVKPTTESMALNRKSALESIVKAMVLGLQFQDRHWRFQSYRDVITGEELINWILLNFVDVSTRREAIEVGDSLIDGGVLEHVKRKHKVLDGFYFYKLATSYTLPTHTTTASTKRLYAVKQVPLNLDPFTKSKRQEIALLHYDTTHNTKNCYHFQVHWLVCTARLIEEMLYTWTRMAEKCGFKLIEANGTQVSTNTDPFQAILTIPLALKPPKVSTIINQGNRIHLSPEWFERALLTACDYVLDTESDSLFIEGMRVFSYQRNPWKYTQFVHRSGCAFVQILPASEGFLWVENRMYSSNGSGGLNGSGNLGLKDGRESRDIKDLNGKEARGRGVKEDLMAKCSDKEWLEVFWDGLEGRLGVIGDTAIGDSVVVDET